MIWFKWLIVAAVGLLALLIALGAFGRSRWASSTRALNQQLETGREAITPTHYNAARELEGLPAPVQRYFRATLSEGQPMITAVSVKHRGMFNMGETTDNWKPFTSTQRVVTRRPGFVWDGRIVMAPGFNVHVHDAYVAGEGILHPSILGLISLMNMRGGGEIAEGELMRFFAEAAWYPTALLPSQGVKWEPVDDSSARATLGDGAIALTMTFTFAADGSMHSVRADARGRTLAGKVVMTPWEGRWSDVQVHDGMRIPMTGEVAWLTPAGRKPYWRGTIVSLRNEFAR